VPIKDPKKRRAYAREQARKRAATPEGRAALAENTRRWRARHPEKAAAARAQDRVWRSSNTEKLRAKEQRRKEDPEQHAKQLLRARGYAAAQREKDPRRVISIKLMSNYGITLEQYEELERVQGGCCAICGRKEPLLRDGKPARWHVDHDHVRKMVRGLLCSSCNNGIGRFKDDPALLQRAASYLLNPPARTVLPTC